MKRQSVKALLKYLSASFPNQLKFPKGDEDKDRMIISTWYDWLKEIDEGKAKMAVKQAAFDNPKWVPSPPSILKAVQRIESDYPSPSKAWQLARKKKKSLHAIGRAANFTREEARFILMQKLHEKRPGKTNGEIAEIASEEISEEEIEEEYKKHIPDKFEVPDIISEAMDQFDGELTGKVDQMHFIRSQFIATYQEVLEEKEMRIGREKYLATDSKTTELLQSNND